MASELQHRDSKLHQLDILLKHVRVISWLNQSSNFPETVIIPPLPFVLVGYPGINPQDILMIPFFWFLKLKEHLVNFPPQQLRRVVTLWSSARLLSRNLSRLFLMGRKDHLFLSSAFHLTNVRTPLQSAQTVEQALICYFQRGLKD